MFQDLINEALETGRPYIKEGEVATYIPELGRADKNKLGISIFCRDGSRFSCGDTKDRFSIQSISKVISLAVALEVCGFDMVFENVGMEPSGDAFNSLIKLEGSNSHPYNPMINSGAIAVASFIEPKVSFGRCWSLRGVSVRMTGSFWMRRSTARRCRRWRETAPSPTFREQGRDQWKCGGSAGFLCENVLAECHGGKPCGIGTSARE